MKILYTIALLLLASTDSVVAAQVKGDNDGWQVVRSKHAKRAHKKDEAQRRLIAQEDAIRKLFKLAGDHNIQKIVLSYLTQRCNKPIKFKFSNHESNTELLIFRFISNKHNALPSLQCVLSTPNPNIFIFEPTIDLIESKKTNSKKKCHIKSLVFSEEEPSRSIEDDGFDPEEFAKYGCFPQPVSCGYYSVKAVDASTLQIAFGEDDPNLEKLRKILVNKDAR